MYAAPREQVVGVGKRRYLMKRALAGIVPDEVLNRKRKSFAPPQPPSDQIKEPPRDWPTRAEIGPYLFSGTAGIVDPARLLEALDKAQRSGKVPAPELERTLTLEFWLRHLGAQGILSNSATPRKSSSLPQYSEPVGTEADDVKNPVVARSPLKNNAERDEKAFKVSAS